MSPRDVWLVLEGVAQASSEAASTNEPTAGGTGGASGGGGTKRAGRTVAVLVVGDPSDIKDS